MKVKYICGIILILSLLCISNLSFATSDFTDFSNVELELKSTSNVGSTSYDLYFNNVTFNKKNSYSVYITNEKCDSIDYSNVEANCAIIDGVYSNIDKELEKNGDIYVSVVESSGGEESIVLLSEKLERPSQNNLGERITGSFFKKSTGDSNIIFFYEPHDSSAGARNINVKIGKVSNEKILNNIKSNGSDGLDDLLSYAKSATAVLSQTFAVGTSSDEFLSKIDLVDGDYYYVYFEADDEDGTYYPVEDIMLTQVKYISNQVQLVSYTDSNFTWKSSSNNNVSTVNNTSTNTSNNTVDNTVANKIIPAAGIKTSITLIIILIVLVGVTEYIKYRKIDK